MSQSIFFSAPVFTVSSRIIKLSSTQGKKNTFYILSSSTLFFLLFPFFFFHSFSYHSFKGLIALQYQLWKEIPPFYIPLSSCSCLPQLEFSLWMTHDRPVFLISQKTHLWKDLLSVTYVHYRQSFSVCLNCPLPGKKPQLPSSIYGLHWAQGIHVCIESA